ncbi:MAG: hypothetical protein CM15mP113_2100 [Pseudomonadota bacterium]|nr:MAG: hypothetical protein CM15mP113_2100 [Pseudomonadota bacterium]
MVMRYLTTKIIWFTCTQDGNTAVKLYPRATDPAANQYLTVRTLLQILSELM